ncbi:MAG: hypothetical protein E7440_05315 [Ruminococcaceae bacterium]|nr:hypothetical protein [Oscillospiraceae bacterium]
MQSCTAGFARLDITPPLGVHLGGYFTVRIADGVLDPLYVNAVAFGEGEKKAVLIVCDLLSIYGNAAHEWPVQIAQKLSLPREAVFTCHTHSHTTPVVDGTRDPSDPQYDAWLLRRMCDAAQMAIDDLKPITDVKWAQGIAPGLTYVRRFKMKDGHYQTWAKVLDPDIDHSASEGDETVRLVRIQREEGPEIALVNFQLHPDNIGGCKYSADFPGVMRDCIEKEKDNVRCVFLNGAEGQMVGTDYIGGTLPNKIMGDPGKSILLGTRLAEYTLPLWDKCVSTGQSGLKCGQAFISAKTKRDPARMPEAERIIAIHEAGKDAEEIGPTWMSTPIVAEAYALRRLEQEQLDYVEMVISAVTFCGLALIGIPGEPFCEIGVSVRKNSPFAVTCMCCHTNGNGGYYATAEAYDQGGYEPRNSRFVKGVGELFTDEASKLLNTLQ